MNEYLQNLKTTIFGAVAGLPVIFDGLEKHDWKIVLAGFGMLLVGIFAKDIKKEN